jgi:hypothetical protein
MQSALLLLGISNTLLLLFIFKKIKKMADQTLVELTAQVEGITTVADSAITLLVGLKTKLDEIATNPYPVQAIQQLSAQLGTEKDKLAAAITANTPAVVPPPVV